LLWGGNNELNSDPDNAGVILVDPTDANIAYIGASTRYPGGSINFPDIEDWEKGHGLIRVDTSDMRDTDYLSPYFQTLTYPNDGDDIIKRADATIVGHTGTGPILESAAAYPNQNRYTGEGVFWYDLNQGINAGTTDDWQFPNVYYSIAFDPQG